MRLNALVSILFPVVPRFLVRGQYDGCTGMQEIRTRRKAETDE